MLVFWHLNLIIPDDLDILCLVTILGEIMFLKAKIRLSMLSSSCLLTLTDTKIEWAANVNALGVGYLA